MSAFAFVFLVKFLMLLLFRLSLAGQDHLDEVFVIDVSGRILLAVDQRLGLLLGHLLPQRGQHVPELGAGDVPVAVLEEHKV